MIRLQEASPEYASLLRPAPLTVPEIQKLLGSDSTLIEYFLVEDDSLAWVIEKDSVHLVHLTSHGKELARRVEDFRRRIAARKSVGVEGWLLYQSLFERLTPFIHHARPPRHPPRRVVRL